MENQKVNIGERVGKKSLKNKFIFIMLSLVPIVIIFFLNYKFPSKRRLHIQINGQKIIALSDRGNPGKQAEDNYSSNLIDAVENRRIVFTGFTGDNNRWIKKQLYSIPYKYRGLEPGLVQNNMTLRNLLENNGNDLWVFLNIANNYGSSCDWLYMKLKYDQKNGEITIDDELIRDVGELTYENLTDVDSEGKRILRSSISVTQIPEGKSISVFQMQNSTFNINGRRFNPDEMENYMPFIHGARFIDDDNMILQGESSLEFYENESKFGGVSYNANYLILSAKDSLEKSKIIQSGFSEVRPRDRTAKLCPLDISPLKNKIAFQALYFNRTNNTADLWLSTWDFKNNNIEKIIKLASDTQDMWKKRGEIYRFNPLTESNLLAVSSRDNIEIIDISKRKIYKELSGTSPKSVRWSPDGTKLGFIKWKANENSNKISSSLWIYDLEKDKLEKIDEDPGYFDFFWVP